MADFKVNKNLSGEIDGLRSTGDALNTGYASIDSAEVNTLKTAMAIIEQHASIKQLLELYEVLVLRDATDMDSFMDEAEEMDAAISSTHTK